MKIFAKNSETSKLALYRKTKISYCRFLQALLPQNIKVIFVEITSHELNGKDPKAKQKEVMKTVAPKEKYRVLYRGNLENIQRLHPEIPLFSARKIRKEYSLTVEEI